MGLDFVRRAARSFHKGLDRRRIELGTPTLFTQEPTVVPRTYAASLRNGQTLKIGDKLGVHLDGDQVLAMRGLSTVATINAAPADLLNALSESHGEACGIVQQVYDIACVAEIQIC
jgi:hypothetical protein